MATGNAITLTEEFSSPVAATRFFAALIDAPILLPKIAPHAIKSIQTLEGNGGPGTIRQIDFAEGTNFKYAKHRIEVLDKETMTFKDTVIEGDILRGKLVSICGEIKFESAPDGKGCKGRRTSVLHPKAGAKIEEEEIKDGKERVRALHDAVEAHLLANPQAYA